MSPRRGSPTTLAALGLLGVLGLGACGGDPSSAPAASVPTPTLTDVHDVEDGLTGVGRLPQPASAWPAAGRDARHSATAEVAGPTSGDIRWQAHLGAAVSPGPVVETDGSIVAATDDGVLHDLDAATGRPRWSYDAGSGYGSDLSTSPAVLADGTILWPGPDDTLYAVSARGTLLWKQQLGGTVLSPAIAGAHRVYVADMSGQLSAFAIEGSQHRLAWTLDVGSGTYASPTVGPDGSIYTSSAQDLVSVRDLGDRGALAWQLHSPAMVEVSAGVSPEGTVVMGTNDAGEFGVAPDGSIRWSLALGSNTYSSSVVAPDGTAYFGDNNGGVWVVDSADGTVRAHQTPRPAGQESVWSQVAVDRDGDYYWASTMNHLYGYDSTGRQLFDLTLDGGVFSYPAIDAAGTLLVGTQAGTLYAIGS